MFQSLNVQSLLIVGIIISVCGVFYLYKELSKLKSSLNQVSKTPAYDTYVKPLSDRPPLVPVQPPPAPEIVEETTKKEL